MLNRLGDVVFWLSCVIAAPLIGIAAIGTFAGSGSDRWWLIVPMAGAAIAVVAVGRAVRYVFGAVA